MKFIEWNIGSYQGQNSPFSAGWILHLLNADRIGVIDYVQETRELNEINVCSSDANTNSNQFNKESCVNGPIQIGEIVVITERTQ